MSAAAALKKGEKKQKYVTYEEYAQIDDGNRYELIDGELYMMASPSDRHQAVLVNLIAIFRTELRGKTCKVRVAPLDVRLNMEDVLKFEDKGKNKQKRRDTVVQPDLLVVCDPEKLGEKYVKGAPDLVIEILSPSTMKHDKITKFRKYQEAGVKELWFVDVDEAGVFAHVLNADGDYVVKAYNGSDAVPVAILPEFFVKCEDIFEE